MVLAQRELFKKSITKADIVIIISSLVLSVLILTFSLNNHSPKDCVVEVNGKEIARYSLEQIQGEKTVEIDNEFGKNVIVIDNNGAKITQSSCPDGLEIKSGKITKSGQSLICLPNRLVVRLEGKDKSRVVSW